MRGVAAVAALLAAACAGGGCASAPSLATVAVLDETYPGAAWARVPDPAAAGWAPRGLEAVRRRLAATQTTAAVVVVGGRVLMDYGDPAQVNIVASVRKSLLAILYGRAVARGRIRLDSTLRELSIDDRGGLSAAEKEATVRDLLSARSGVYHPAANSGDDSSSAPPRGSQRHGAYFLYNNWDFNALGTIFEKATGEQIYDAFAAELARPLHMQDFARGVQRKGGDATISVHLAYHFRLSTRDLARVGHLMLHDGAWAGRQLVPRDWVREITRVVTPARELNPPSLRRGPWGYGYLWWVWDAPWAVGPYRRAFIAHGMGGQHLAVLPAMDLVVAHETRHAEGQRVSHAEFRGVLDLLLRARCPAPPC